MVASIVLALDNRVMARTQQAAAKRSEQAGGFDTALARAIKVLRAERGMERKELARLSGLSYPYVSEIEQGKKRPSSESLVVIARALRLRQSELLERAERLGERDPQTAPSLRPKDRVSQPHGYGRVYRLAGGRASTSPAELEELAARAAQLGADDFYRVLDLVRRLGR